MAQKVKAKKSMTALRQYAQGATLGWGDEVYDRAGAGIAKLFLPEMSYEELLAQARANTKADLAADWEDNPVLSVGANLTGGLATGAFGGAKKLADLSRGASRLATTLRSAGVGAGLGAVSGTGAGFDADSRLSGLFRGALLGAPLGAAAGVVTHGIGQQQPLVKSAEKAAKKYKTKAEQVIADLFLNRDDLPDVLKQAEKLDAASKAAGVPLTLAEKTAYAANDPLINVQGSLSSNKHVGRDMSAFYQGRKGDFDKSGSIEASLRKMSSMFGADDFDTAAQEIISNSDEAAKKITSELSGKARPLYGEAYSKAVPPNQLKSLASKQPIIENAIKTALKDERFSAQLKGKPLNSVEVLDAAKRIIDEKIRSGSNPAQPFDTRAYSEASGLLLDLADQYAPAYAQARGVYSGSPDKLAMRERIGNLAEIDPLDAQKLIPQLFKGTEETASVTAKALGPNAPKVVGARILNALDTNKGQAARAADMIAPDERTLAQLRAYGGNTQPLEDALNVINRTKMSDRVAMGSPTDALRETKGMLEQGANAALDVATGGKTGIVRKVMEFAFKPSAVKDQQYYKDLYEIMTTDRGMGFLRSLSQQQQGIIAKDMELAKNLRGLSVTKGQVPALASPAAVQTPVSSIASPSAPRGAQQPPIEQQEYDTLPEGFIAQPAALPQVEEYDELPEGFVVQPQSSAGDIFDRMKTAESGGNPNAQAATSSASGLYQFTDGTWRNMVAKHGKQYGITEGMKNDPKAQEIIVRKLAEENAAALQASTGKNLTDGDIYLAHFMGAGDASRMINAIGTGQPAAALFPAAAKANKSIFFKNGRPRTVEEVYKVVTSKV